MILTTLTILAFTLFGAMVPEFLTAIGQGKVSIPPAQNVVMAFVGMVAGLQYTGVSL